MPYVEPDGHIQSEAYVEETEPRPDTLFGFSVAKCPGGGFIVTETRECDALRGFQTTTAWSDTDAKPMSEHITELAYEL